MKKNSSTPPSQDYDRKNEQGHIPQNPGAAKDKSSIASAFMEDKRKVDKREIARQEHTNHFTNRASKGEK